MKKRICIYAKDIQTITGRSARYAYGVIAEIKRIKQKNPKHLVTVKEFSDYVGIDEEEIYKLID